MPIVKFSSESISKLTCPEGKRSIQYCDRDFPGLILEVRNSSTSTWWLRYKNQAKSTKYTRLGHYPQVSLSQARQLAAAQKERIQYLGADPRAEEDARKAVPTFTEFMTGPYADYVRTRKITADKDAEYFRLRLKDSFGYKKLNQISRREIQLFHSKLRDEGLAPATCNHYLKLMKRALNLAIHWEVIEGPNPAVGIQQFKEMNEVENYLDEKQLSRLLDVLRTDANRSVCDIILYLMSTGARCGEALSARWDMIDMDHRVWRVPAKNSKSGKIRSIPLNDMAREVLARQDTKDVFEYVFINRHTKQRYVTIQRVWQRLRKKAGVPFFRIHDCRHFFCSQLVSNGRTLYEVQQIAGHASPRTTQRYSRVSTKALQDASSVAGDAIKDAMKRSA